MALFESQSQRRAVNGIAPCFGGAVGIEAVTQMPAAIGAMNFRAWQDDLEIGRQADGFAGNRCAESREIIRHHLGGGRKDGGIAGAASIGALAAFAQQVGRPRRFILPIPQNTIGVIAKAFAPFILG